MPVLIIAEAGVNHNGDIVLAKKMADIAKDAGADIVKYQTAVPELVISRFAPKAQYQKQFATDDESQLEMVRRLHFGFDGHKELYDYCKKIGITYLSSGFDLPSLEFLSTLNLPYCKVPSGEITNLPYLEKIGAAKTPVLLSTGMCTLPEIEDALLVLENAGAGPITLLHCNTEYPSPLEDANLFAMLTLADVFGLPVGYSDHTQGTLCAVAAVAMGAVVIEKHFTIDKNLPGPDHKASLEPKELAQLVKDVRACQTALGDAEKKVSQSEAKNRDIARKSIVAKRDIKKGELFSQDNLCTKRPGNGLSPMRWHTVLGQVACKDFAQDEQIKLG